MPNPVAANDLQPISGSLQTSRISYGVETAGKNYGQDYNGTTWYSDIPNNGQFYTIISDNYTANYYVSRSNAEGAYVEGGLPAVDEYSAPVFWTTVGTSSLDVITIVNGLPDRIGQTPFVSGSQALNWIASSSNYFAVGPDYYEQIDADQLALYLDSNQIISYPTTASFWYDISGYNWKATLLNGISFNTTYNTLKFDDSDDYGIFTGSNGDILSSASYASGNATWEGIVRFNAGTGTDAVITKWDNSTGENWWFGRYPNDTVHLALITSAGYQGLFSSTTISTSTSKFQQIAVTTSGSNYVFYIDGANAGGGTYSGTWVTPDTDTPVALGAQNTSTGGAALFGGDMSKVRLYNKTLSATEILQNYYGGPIITDGLIYAIDAGNIISYPRTGTTAYPLTGSNTDTLTNGVGFNPSDGGVWTFDGVDDYINLSTDPWPANAFTNDSISIWFKFSNYGVILGQSNTTPFTQSGWVPAIYIDTSFYLRTSVFWGGATTNQSVSPSPLSINTWYNVTVTNGSNIQKTYLNGELIATLSKTQSSYTSTYYYTLGAGVWNSWDGTTGVVGYLQGQIANLYYYDKELSADEVLQNYNATK
jgi:hypothetical protein